MMIVTSLSTPSTVDIRTKVKTLAHVPVAINNHQLHLILTRKTTFQLGIREWIIFTLDFWRNVQWEQSILEMLM